MNKAMNAAEITPLLLELLNTGNINGLSAVYEENAVLIIGENHQTAKGLEQIKAFYADLIKQMPKLDSGVIKIPIVNGNIALTSSVLTDGRTTAEIARKQPDGSWKWCLDDPMIAIPDRQ